LNRALRKRIRGALFDVDGTLIDSVDQHASAWRDAFREFGKRVTKEEVRSQVGKGSDQFLPVFLTREEIKRFGKELVERRGKVYLKRYFPTVKPFPKVKELLRTIRAAGVRVVLASSAEESELKKYVKLAGIGDLIESYTSSEDAQKSKPHPDIFQAALKKLGKVRKREVVVVGDSPFDAQGATRAGLKSIGFLSGGFTRAQLRRAGVCEIYKDPADLLKKFNRSLLAK
jgi:HAD superfamily hydrolase (TIGR01549 family)